MEVVDKFGAPIPWSGHKLKKWYSEVVNRNAEFWRSMESELQIDTFTRYACQEYSSEFIASPWKKTIKWERLYGSD